MQQSDLMRPMGMRYADLNPILEELKKEGWIFRGVSHITIKGR